MRAFAAARAPTLQKKKESNKNSKEGIKRRQAETRQQNLPSEALATFRYSAHYVPKAMNFFIKAWKKRHE
jgi:hypothetical protein